MEPTLSPHTIRSAVSARGELVLRRRADGALELRVNGVFVMDTVETTTERALAQAALRLDDPHVVLVGGLGLGFTTAELLTDPRARQVVVAEIEPDLVAWMTDGTVEHGPPLMHDDRVHVHIADVRDAVTDQATAGLDAMLLDVDNGPDSLVLDANASLYASSFLRTCLTRLRPGGLLVVWSATESHALEAALLDVAGSYAKRTHPVDLAGHAETYTIYSVTGAEVSLGHL